MKREPGQLIQRLESVSFTTSRVNLIRRLDEDLSQQSLDLDI